MVHRSTNQGRGKAGAPGKAGARPAVQMHNVGTRHNGVSPSLATLTRMPLAMPTATQGNAQGKGQGAKTQYMHDLLKQAGKNGITWQAMRQALIAKFGQAPKKRRTLYLLLNTLAWHKTTGANGVVTYFLGNKPAPQQGK